MKHTDRPADDSRDHGELTAPAAAPEEWPPVLDHPFQIIAFDWDGTAVENRRVDATAVRLRLERLLQLGVRIVVITGTNFPNVNRQFSSAIKGPYKQRLYICTNRGSEVYSFDAASQPVLLWHRQATPQEDQKLTVVAETVERTIEEKTGLDIKVVYDRLNRRKIDLIPVAEWADPPKSQIGRLLQATERRLLDAGLPGGLKEVIALTRLAAAEVGLADARLTSDVKHVEIGLTDKSDSVAWVVEELALKKGICSEDILIVGDEFGPIAGFEGSDYRMVTPVAQGAVYVSVGPEPNGVPPGVIHLGGGPRRFNELLDRQIYLDERLHWGLSLPLPPADPTWLLYEEGFNPAREHEVESLFTVSNGYAGTRGSLCESTPYATPGTFVAGLFEAPEPGGRPSQLVIAPDWTRLDIVVDNQPLNVERGEILEHRRVLDMRRGLLLRDWRQRDPAGRITHVRIMRFASLVDRHALLRVLSLSPENYSGCLRLETLVDGLAIAAGGPALLAPIHAATDARGPLLVLRTLNSNVVLAMDEGSLLSGATSPPPEHRAFAEEGRVGERWSWEALIGRKYRLDTFVSIYTSRDTPDPAALASASLARLVDRGMEQLLREHVDAWATHWDKADVEIQGDPAAQRGTRFAIYHLISSAYPGDEGISIGARGLTGKSYEGHVFWDTETFMLPFYIFTDPHTARALLMYRYHTLAAARAKASDMGYRGALYAWESAATGEETTPPVVVMPGGRVVPVLSGTMEQHISADVAYAVWQYWKATGDDGFILDAGAEILLEVARFWASRVTRGADGRYHILKVIGPDEYHEAVDDNAFTNWMASWSLLRGAEIAGLLRATWPGRWQALSTRLDISPDEPRHWEEIAEAIVTGLDKPTGLIEQFAGYFGLDYVDLRRYEPRTAPMDVLLGRDRTQASQVIKQADVVLLLHLLWDTLPAEVREANFIYYEPRTGHGSSLSPGVYALVAARLGDPDKALAYYRQAYEIDLANNMGNAAGGVHSAAQGSLWQAAIFGFAGLSLREDGLRFAPHLPRTWDRLAFAVQWRGRTLRVAFHREPRLAEVLLEGAAPLTVQLDDRPSQAIQPGRTYRAMSEETTWGPWEEVS